MFRGPGPTADGVHRREGEKDASSDFIYLLVPQRSIAFEAVSAASCNVSISRFSFSVTGAKWRSRKSSPVASRHLDIRSATRSSNSEVFERSRLTAPKSLG